MKLFTVGYGNRSADDLTTLLRAHGVVTIVDVRLRPDRSRIGTWVKAKTPDKGIERVLTAAGIAYRSLPELGNVFLDDPDWRPLYTQLLEQSGELLARRLAGIPEPYCLLCAESKVADCHRAVIADFLARTRGAEVEHLE